MHDFQSKLPRLPCTGRHFLFLILKMPDSAHLSWLLCNRSVRQPSKQALGTQASGQSNIQAARHPGSHAARRPSNQASTQPGNRAHPRKNRRSPDRRFSVMDFNVLSCVVLIFWMPGNRPGSSAMCPRPCFPGHACRSDFP